MLRSIMWLSLALCLPALSGTAFAQGVPAGCGPFPWTDSCCPPPPAPPIRRTVQVDVPIPSAPAPACLPTGVCPTTCYPPPCAPPCPTRPVEVKVDVRVRPVPCGAQPPDSQLCGDPLRPLFGIVAATMAAPIRILQCVLPPPPIPRLPLGCMAPSPGCFSPGCPPMSVSCCAPPAPPPCKVRPTCAPASYANAPACSPALPGNFPYQQGRPALRGGAAR